MKRAAFTLVEMLVALAIVAVLTALVMQGIKGARDRGEAASCTANLRQLVGANLAYAADHGGQFVPAQERRNLVRWHGVRETVGQPFDGGKGPLAPYLGREGRVKLCPTLRHVVGGSKSFEEGAGGYGYNAAYIGGTVQSTWTPERLPNLEKPARTVMFTDTAFARASGLQEYAYSEPFFSEKPAGRFRSRMQASVHFRHGTTANVAWCDGHVTAEEPSEIDGKNLYGGDAVKWKLGWFGPSAQNGYWRP
jgi:prepilin-type processing-associated H-X9-DG protein/prepilin-type N-terminal cleavage/methylation domain-containing protein